MKGLKLDCGRPKVVAGGRGGGIGRSGSRLLSLLCMASRRVVVLRVLGRVKLGVWSFSFLWRKEVGIGWLPR